MNFVTRVERELNLFVESGFVKHLRERICCISRFFYGKKTGTLQIMGIDYSRQAGRKITTKGYKKKTVNVDEIIYIKREGYLSTLCLQNGEKIVEKEQPPFSLWLNLLFVRGVNSIIYYHNEKKKNIPQLSNGLANIRFTIFAVQN